MSIHRLQLVEAEEGKSTRMTFCGLEASTVAHTIADTYVTCEECKEKGKKKK
jgi:uncharacterized metal-binding protein